MKMIIAWCRCIALALAACTKPKPPVTEFDLDLGSDDAFVKVANHFQGNGHGFERFDRNGLVLATRWKNISADELAEYATTKDSLDRYSEGRIRYRLTFTQKEDKARIKVDVEIESFLTPRQSGSEDFGTRKVWEPATTKGVAEKVLASTLSG